MKSTTALTWHLATPLLIGLLSSGSAFAGGPGTFMFDFNSSPTPYQVKLGYGQQHRFQFCATKEVSDSAHRFIWPGAPLPLTLKWSQTINGGEAWPAPNMQLPLSTTMEGPLSDGRWCSRDLVVNYDNFPKSGRWSLKATINGAHIGTLLVNWSITPHLAVQPRDNSNFTAKPKVVLPPSGAGQPQGTGQKQSPSHNTDSLKAPRLKLPAVQQKQ